MAMPRRCNRDLRIDELQEQHGKARAARGEARAGGGHSARHVRTTDAEHSGEKYSGFAQRVQPASASRVQQRPQPTSAGVVLVLALCARALHLLARCLSVTVRVSCLRVPVRVLPLFAEACPVYRVSCADDLRSAISLGTQAPQPLSPDMIKIMAQAQQ